MTTIRRIFAFGLVLVILVAVIAWGIYASKMQQAKSALDFQTQIQNENVDDLTLTIYYTIPILLTPFPWSADILIRNSEDDKVVVDGSELKEHLDLFTQLNSDILKPKIKKSSYTHAYLYYVLESKTSGKIVDVLMGGSDGGTFVNGVEFEDNNIFQEIILPFLPEEDARFLRKHN